MKKIGFLLSVINLLGCSSSEGQLKELAKLPKKVTEASGITTAKNTDLLWIHNDSGNKNKIYGINLSGEIKKEIEIQAKNIDWEDITSDDKGNIYLADFGNNNSKRKNLVIYKIDNDDLSKKSVSVEKIEFSYENQSKFPPKKEDCFFDAEALFYNDDYLYIFTKSRVKNKYGVTNLYKLQVKKGNQVAKLIGTYTNCSDKECWITGAAISPNSKKVALLTLNSVIIFYNFSSDNFLEGKSTRIPLGFTSQKEAITFKNNNTIYIADEKEKGRGGKLYELKI